MDPQQVPDAAEFGRLAAALAGLGLNPGQILAAIGAQPGGRTRRQVTDALRLWLAGAAGLREGMKRVDAAGAGVGTEFDPYANRTVGADRRVRPAATRGSRRADP